MLPSCLYLSLHCHRQNVEPVKDLLPPNIFSLPQVVVSRVLQPTSTTPRRRASVVMQILGTENAGKSSLLENILKTEVC